MHYSSWRLQHCSITTRQITQTKTQHGNSGFKERNEGYVYIYMYIYIHSIYEHAYTYTYINIYHFFSFPKVSPQHMEHYPRQATCCITKHTSHKIKGIKIFIKYPLRLYVLKMEVSNKQKWGGESHKHLEIKQLIIKQPLSQKESRNEIKRFLETNKNQGNFLISQ